MRFVFTVALAAMLTPAVARSGTWPTSAQARQWRPDPAWMRSALCIHGRESGDWHRNHVDWRGSPSLYSGGMQFMDSTFQSAGGTGAAWQWSPREQLYRAWVVWRRDGDSWSEWGTAGGCGLR